MHEASIEHTVAAAGVWLITLSLAARETVVALDRSGELCQFLLDRREEFGCGSVVFGLTVSFSAITLFNMRKLRGQDEILGWVSNLLIYFFAPGNISRYSMFARISE